MRFNEMDPASVTAMDAGKSSGDLWGGNSNLSNNGWGEPASGTAPKCEGGSGWGSPSPSPNPNAGTDSWGTNKQVQPQAWGAANEPPAKLPTPEWGASDIKPAASSVGSIGWNSAGSSTASSAPAPAPASSSWGDNESKSSDAGSWGSQADLTTQASVWGQSENTATPNTTAPSAVSNEGSANATTAPRPISASWSSESNSAAQATHPQGAWTGGSPFSKQQSQGWPSGRPLTNDVHSISTGPPTSDVELAREKLIAAAVNTQDGWGAQPVRQDTDWSTEQVAAPPPMARRRNSSEEDHNWVQPNTNGTAIWETKQEPPPRDWVRTHSRSSSTSSGGANEWNNTAGSVEDPNNWNGSRDPAQWARPAQPSQQQWANKPENGGWDRSAAPRPMPNEAAWLERNAVDPNQRIDPAQQRAIAGAGAAGPGPGPGPGPGQWRPKPDGTMWTGNEPKPTDDNMWDRDGTHVWGKTETGSWPNKLQQRPLAGNNGQFWNENQGPNPNSRTGSWEGQPPNHMGMQQRPGESARLWPDGQPAPAPVKKWPEENQAQWNPQQPPPPATAAVNSSTWVNPTPVPNPNISMDGTHIWKQNAAVCKSIYINLRFHFEHHQKETLSLTIYIETEY